MEKKKKMEDRIMKALNFAGRKHIGQVDDNNRDYFTAHLLPVYLALKQLTNDENVLIAGLLHDTLEDTETTYAELFEEFGEIVADLVYELTHYGKNDKYGFYFPNLKSADAIMIKMIDRASNISRMYSWDEKRKKQYLKRSKFWKDGTDRRG